MYLDLGCCRSPKSQWKTISRDKSLYGHLYSVSRVSLCVQKLSLLLFHMFYCAKKQKKHGTSQEQRQRVPWYLKNVYSNNNGVYDISWNGYWKKIVDIILLGFYIYFFIWMPMVFLSHYSNGYTVISSLHWCSPPAVFSLGFLIGHYIFNPFYSFTNKWIIERRWDGLKSASTRLSLSIF